MGIIVKSSEVKQLMLPEWSANPRKAVSLVIEFSNNTAVEYFYSETLDKYGSGVVTSYRTQDLAHCDTPRPENAFTQMLDESEAAHLYRLFEALDHYTKCFYVVSTEGDLVSKQLLNTEMYYEERKNLCIEKIAEHFNCRAYATQPLGELILF